MDWQWVTQTKPYQGPGPMARVLITAKVGRAHILGISKPVTKTPTRERQGRCQYFINQLIAQELMPQPFA